VAGHVRPHGLRHTAITALLDSGASLREAQRFSRHADPRTLMRYDDNRSDIAGEMARRVSELL
jgi:integrase/recombinase XerC